MSTHTNLLRSPLHLGQHGPCDRTQTRLTVEIPTRPKLARLKLAWVFCLLLVVSAPPCLGQKTFAHYRTAVPSGDDIVVLEMGESVLSISNEELLANDPPASGVAELSEPVHGDATSHHNSVVYGSRASLLASGFDSFRYTLDNPDLDQGTVYVVPETYSRVLHLDPIDSPIFNPHFDWAVTGNTAAVTTNDQDPIDGPYDLLLQGGSQPLWVISVKAKGGGTTTGSKTGFEAGPGGNFMQPGVFTAAVALDDESEAVWELAVQTTDLGTTLQAHSRDGFGGVVSTHKVPFMEGGQPDKVTFYWWSATAPGLSDGRMALFINQRLAAAKDGIGFNSRPLTDFRYGIGNSWLYFNGVTADHTGKEMRLDNLGIWSEVKMPGHLPSFADGFETGDLEAWQGSQDPNGWMRITQAAALSGLWGLDIRPDRSSSGSGGGGGAVNASAMVGRRLVQPQDHLRARFLINADELEPSTDPITVLSAHDSVRKEPQLEVRAIYVSNRPFLSVRAYDQPAQQWRESPWFPLEEDAPNQIEVKWWSSPRAQAARGGFRWWIDGQERTPEQFDSGASINHVQFGIVRAEAIPQGRLWLDDLQIFW